jgi:aconitate hydratase
MDKELGKGAEAEKRVPVVGRSHDLGHGDVVIAAITSCTNSSNPSVMMGAGLLSRNAVAKGLTVKPWVKTSLAPGSKVVGEYLDKSGLQSDLDKLGFNLVAYGCTSCIGNSGPLAREISKTINEHDLFNAAVLSGNRNFEARVNPDVRANYLASPLLVVAYALAGSMNADLVKQPLGIDKKGKKVFLKDIWPSSREIGSLVRKTITKKIYTKKYADVFKGETFWRKISVKGGLTYEWDKKSTYVQNPPFFAGMRAVVCQTFERIHRSNLISMGVLPLCFEEGMSWQTLGLKGDEQVTIRGLQGELKPRQRLMTQIIAADGGLRRIPVICRIDTLDELDYFKHGGILQYVLRQLLNA